MLLPGVRTTVRLVRGEFEEMIRDDVEASVEVLRRAVTSAGIAPADLTTVLLVGGSSRIPLVAQLVSAGLDRPVAVDADPKNAIALGAALAATPGPDQVRKAAPPAAARTIPGPGAAAATGAIPRPWRRHGHRGDPPTGAAAPSRSGSRRSDRGAAGRRGRAARRPDRRRSAARHDQPRRRRAPHPDPRRAQRAARSAATGRRTRPDRGSRQGGRTRSPARRR